MIKFDPLLGRPRVMDDERRVEKTETVYVGGGDSGGGVSTHDALTDVAADQHHAESHAIGSHTGTLDHGGLSGLTDNDHTQYVLDAGDTMTGQLMIDGGSDQIQLLVQANATQTANLAVFENSSGADQITFAADGGAVFNEAGNAANFRIESDTNANFFLIDGTNGRLGIGDSTPDHLIDIDISGTRTDRLLSITADTTATRAVQIDATMVAGTTSTGIMGVEGFIEPTANLAAVYVLNNESTLTNSNFNITNLSVYRVKAIIGASYTGTITRVENFKIDIPTMNGSDPSEIYGLRVLNQGNAGTTDTYGIMIGDMSGSTNNYALVTNLGHVVFNEGGVAGSDVRMESDTITNLFFLDSTNNRIGIGTSAPFGLFDINRTTGGILTLSRTDTTASAADMIGKVEFYNNDTQLTTQNIYADIEVQANQTISTNAAAGKMIFRVTGTTVGGSPVEQLNLVDGTATLKDALNIAVGSTTGTKIGTATTQKLGFYNATPVVQATTIADADGTLADITTKFNSLLSKLETYGLLASA